jgi:hypothetical protein
MGAVKDHAAERDRPWFLRSIRERKPCRRPAGFVIYLDARQALS